ncbi:MAG: aquaporin [Solirubrobacteraceae bacterium]
MVLGIIMFMGKVSGAHLNPAVSIARSRCAGTFRGGGRPGTSSSGATLAALVLHAVINVSAVHGSNYVASGYSAGAGFWMELLLTFGLVSVILGTASGAQNIGIIAALGWARISPSPGCGAARFRERVAAAVAFVLRGPGGGMSGSAAAQGALYTETQRRGGD